jgi:hypothetical protein
MKSKSLHRSVIVFLCFLALSCSKAGTYFLSIRYDPNGEFPSLQKKIGSTLGIAPFKDARRETLYIGIYNPLQGVSSHFKSDPFPLEKAIQESLSNVLTRNGIKTLPVSNWDEKPESLRNMETDSVIMIEIKRFWVEGKASLFKTHVKASVQFIIHLGVKEKRKVFTRNVEVEKEMTVARLTPERVEQQMNRILVDTFNSYFNNPYGVE